jgi:hypothetical protein
VLSSQSDRVSQRTFSTEKVPEEDYYNGHLLVDHLEYLDDMLDKTLDIESTMKDLKYTYAQKREAFQNVGSESSEEMEALFEKAASQKEQMSSQIASLKTILTNAKNGYAVDAPDGTSDAQVKEGLKQVNQIIDHAAAHEDADKVDKHHKLEEAVRKERARDPEHDW